MGWIGWIGWISSKRLQLCKLKARGQLFNVERCLGHKTLEISRLTEAWPAKPRIQSKIRVKDTCDDSELKVTRCHLRKAALGNPTNSTMNPSGSTMARPWQGKSIDDVETTCDAKESPERAGALWERAHAESCRAKHMALHDQNNMCHTPKQIKHLHSLCACLASASMSESAWL